MIVNGGPELGQTNHRVVRRFQISELLVQEALQSGHIGQGEVVRRGERLSSSESQAEEEQAEQSCGHTAGTRGYLYAYLRVTGP